VLFVRLIHTRGKWAVWRAAAAALFNVAALRCTLRWRKEEIANLPEALTYR